MILLDLKKRLQGTQGAFELQLNDFIEKGVFLALYGKSGAGKTTVLRMLSGLEKPDFGTIKIGDEIWFDASKKINRTPQKRSIGYVFQDDVLFENMNVLQNLKFALPKNQESYFLEELIEIMELKGLLNFKTQQLSGGQKQRISLARALVQQPKLLLLDEPLSALDFEMRQNLQQYILKAHKSYGLTTILVSHDPWEVHKMANFVWEIENGKVIKKGIPKEVLPLKFKG